MSRVHLKAPPGFVDNKQGLPGMSLVGEPEQEPWRSTRVIQDQSHILKVSWEAERAKFLCLYTLDEAGKPNELIAFDYPHEVVNWVGGWYKKLHTQAVQVEDE